MNIYPYSIIDTSDNDSFTGHDFYSLVDAARALVHCPSWWVIEDRLGNRFTAEDCEHAIEMDDMGRYAQHG